MLDGKRCGKSLLELLIAMAIILLMMSMLAQVAAVAFKKAMSIGS